MSELPAELDLLSRDFASQLFIEMIDLGQLPTLAPPMQDEIIEAAHRAVSSPVGERQPCGCVEIRGPFTSAVTVQQRAQLAISGFAAPYESLFAISAPQETLAFVQSSGYLQALTAVGSLAALLEERGRLALESGKSFLSAATDEQPAHEQHS